MIIICEKGWWKMIMAKVKCILDDDNVCGIERVMLVKIQGLSLRDVDNGDRLLFIVFIDNTAARLQMMLDYFNN